MSGTINSMLRWVGLADPQPDPNALYRRIAANPVGTEQVPTVATAADPSYQPPPSSPGIYGWLQQQQQASADRGLWTGGQVWEGGHPTEAGVVDVAQQYGNAMLLGTTAPGGRGFNLERIHPRTLHPLSTELDLQQAGNHAFSIKGPNGEALGIIDTEWNPKTGGLRIADIQSEAGTRSLGAGAVRELRELLLAQYPGATTLSGSRITGARYADRRTGTGPGREAVQVIRNPQGEP